MNNVLLKPADIIILLLAVALTVWLYTFFWFGNTASGDAEFLTIQIADNPPQRYDLGEDRMIEIEGAMGKSVIEIKQKKARFIHSPCRNKVCIIHGWLSSSGDISACLPNKMSISLHGSLQQQGSLQQHGNQYDAIAGGQ